MGIQKVVVEEILRIFLGNLLIFLIYLGVLLGTLTTYFHPMKRKEEWTEPIG
jgi:hypothetical protein